MGLKQQPKNVEQALGEKNEGILQSTGRYGDTDPPVKPKPKVKLIWMIRDTPPHKGGATRVQVHPDEVDNYGVGGWMVDPNQEEAK